VTKTVTTTPAPARPHRSRVAAAVVTGLVALLGLVPLSAAVGTTDAAWRDSEHARGTFTAGTLGPPRTGTCTPRQAPGERSMVVTWQPPNTGTVTDVTYDYRVAYQPDGGGAGSVPVEWTSIGSATTFTYTRPVGLLDSGSYSFSVRARAGAWTSATITGSARGGALLLLSAITECTW
jgi:hypothetical protein